MRGVAKTVSYFGVEPQNRISTRQHSLNQNLLRQAQHLPIQSVDMLQLIATLQHSLRQNIPRQAQRLPIQSVDINMLQWISTLQHMLRQNILRQPQHLPFQRVDICYRESPHLDTFCAKIYSGRLNT